MRTWACLLLSLWLAACAQAPVAPPPDRLFQDHLFAAPSEPVNAGEVFALSDGMRRYLATDIATQVRLKGRQWALVDALQRPGQLKLEYDSGQTRNAAQAFEARAGNCLSLVIMTAAFAKELGLQVEYQSAFIEETWSRSADLYLRSGHVNLTLGRRFIDHGTQRDHGALTIDFLPEHEIRGLRTRAITEDMVIAMFMNNRAAEALVRGNLDDAYWWAREAVRQSPNFLSSFNTIGVIYMRHGELSQAELAFNHVLRHEPANTRSMHNLAQLLGRQGRDAESASLYRRLAQIEPHPPFHFFHLGLAAMERNDFRAARDLFAKEVDRAEYNAEFQFWLGLANFKLGDVERARKHLALAKDASTTRREQDLYAAKLAWLRAHRAH